MLAIWKYIPPFIRVVMNPTQAVFSRGLSIQSHQFDGTSQQTEILFIISSCLDLSVGKYLVQQIAHKREAEIVLRFV